MKCGNKRCYLCGKKILKIKGMNQRVFEYEMQRGAHISCLRVHEGIERKHRISNNDYLTAIIEGLFLLFPELEETNSVKDYKSRAKRAKEEIKEKFEVKKNE